MKLKILDPVDCQVVTANKDELRWLQQLLSYRAEYFLPGQFAMRRREYQASVVARVKDVGYIFPVGLLPRVRRTAEQAGRPLEVEGKLPRLEPTAHVNVPGLTLRDDQLRLINAAVRQQRGVIISPTGSGKTAIALGLLSRFPDARALIVTHSKDIVTQTLAELRARGFDAGPPGTANVVITTRQALVGKGGIKLGYANMMRGLDIIIIDEVHLFGGADGQYSKLLRSSLAPVRLGLTGTKPDAESATWLAIEGALGDTVDEVTYEEGRALNILADVKLELITVPVRSNMRDFKTYKEILKHGLVENLTRHRLIISKAAELVKRGLTVLIFVNELMHGDQLEEMARLLELPAPFLEGATGASTRDAAKAALQAGRCRCVITSKIWREGVNIPNLGAVILAGGGKAELSTLQTIGRALRTAPGKEQAVVVDCLDPYRYLAEHTVQRLSIYQELGWL